MKKKDGRNRSASVQATIRDNVVEFLKKKGSTQRQASEIFGLSRSGVEKICRTYRKSGQWGIAEKKRGVQGGKKIDSQQSDEVRQLVKDKLPDHLKLPFGLWTREAVKQLMRKRYGTDLSRRQVGRYLKIWGYTSQKTINNSFEQKPKRAKEWLKKEYPEIKKRAKLEKAAIYFGDETGRRSEDQTDTSHGAAGKTPVIKKTKPHFLPNLISAINNRDHLQFMVINGQFNSEVFQTFLEQMIKHGKQKIFFITDGYFAYKTKKLDKWLEKNSKRIEVFFLSPCNPD